MSEARAGVTVYDSTCCGVVHARNVDLDERWVRGDVLAIDLNLPRQDVTVRLSMSAAKKVRDFINAVEEAHADDDF